MKPLIYIASLLLLPLLLHAQGHGVSIALRGGTVLYSGTEYKSQPTISGGADIHYQCLWDCYHDIHIGIETGLGIGLDQAEFGGELSNSFIRQDIYGNELQYNVSAKVNQIFLSLQLDLPLLFTTHLKGVVLSIGPRLQSGIAEGIDQMLKREQINVYLPRYDVTIHNEPILGYVPEEKLNGRDIRLAPTLSLALSAEIGYEWGFSNYHTHRMHGIGLLLYAHYGIWTLPSTNNEHILNVPAIDINEPQPQAPQLEVGNLCAISNRYTHPISVGIRLYYTLREADYTAYGWHRSRHKFL